MLFQYHAYDNFHTQCIALLIIMTSNISTISYFNTDTYLKSKYIWNSTHAADRHHCWMLAINYTITYHITYKTVAFRTPGPETLRCKDYMSMLDMFYPGLISNHKHSFYCMMPHCCLSSIAHQKWCVDLGQTRGKAGKGNREAKRIWVNNSKSYQK